MPYANLPEALWSKMDSCVEQVQADGNDKEKAIAICYTAVTKEKAMNETAWSKVETGEKAENLHSSDIPMTNSLLVADNDSGVAIKKEESALVKSLSDFVTTIKELFETTFKAGARHSKADNASLQTIHDEAVALGAECMGKMSVIKQANGQHRWVMFSSTAFQDRDGEIISQKALSEDVARMDASGDYGPLNWWHIQGLNLGQCDYNAMDGKVLIESGTFVSDGVGEAIAAKASNLGGSIEFYHPPTEPVMGVYSNIRRFGRAILPEHKAANLFTSLKVKEHDMDKAKFESLKELVGDSLAAELVKQSEAVQKAAVEAGVKFKAQGETAEEKAAEPPPAKRIGDMTEGELKEFIARAVGDMSAAKKEAEETQTNKEQALQAELTKVKNLQNVAAKRLAELEAQLKDLTGEQPRINTQGYRATADPATIREKAAQVTQDLGPRADPNFINFLTGAGNASNHSSAH